MSDLYSGVKVRFKTMQEVCEYSGFTEMDLYDGVDIDGIAIPIDALEYLGDGEAYYINDYDPSDDCVYVGDTSYWWPAALVDVVSEPGEYWGFKVGDKVEFRQYDEMRDDGSLHWNWFSDEMRYLCGQEAVITRITPRRDKRFAVVTLKSDADLRGYEFTTGMFNKHVEIPDVDLESFGEVAFL